MYRGQRPFVDFWDKDTAFDFAQRLAESPDRMDVQVFRHELPEPDEATKQRIRERIQRQVNGDALMKELTQ